MTIQTTPPAKSEIAQHCLLSMLQVWGLLVLSLHLAAFKLAEATAWSLWPYTFLPAWLGWVLALLAGALTLPAFSGIMIEGVRRLWRVWPGKHDGRHWFALAAVLAGWLFWLARLRHLRWGDAYLLTVHMAYPPAPLIYNWQAPLTVFIHQRLWQFVAQPLLNWPVENVYTMISICCGIIFVYVLLTFLTRLGRHPLETAILAGLVLTTGSMQLFFGYVENYTIISVGLLIMLFLAWRALQGEIQPVWPVLALSVTNGFHPSTVFLWPGMVCLLWLCWRRGFISLTAALWQLVLPPLLIGGGVLLLMESGQHGLAALFGEDRPGGGDGIWFVPLFATRTKWEHYTMFSVGHGLDWSNEQLLISPFGLPLIGLSLGVIYHFDLTIFDKQSDKDYGYFLGAMVAAYLLFTWLWNADYGGRKDWDLFAPSAFIYTLFAGYLLVRLVPNKESLTIAGLSTIAISLLHTGAWVFTNTHILPRN